MYAFPVTSHSSTITPQITLPSTLSSTPFKYFTTIKYLIILSRFIFKIIFKKIIHAPNTHPFNFLHYFIIPFHLALSLSRTQHAPIIPRLPPNRNWIIGRLMDYQSHIFVFFFYYTVPYFLHKRR